MCGVISYSRAGFGKSKYIHNWIHILAKIPAIISSSMIPAPPGTLFSIMRIGGGLNISNNLNNTKAAKR